MTEGIVEKIVGEEIERYGDDVFTEFKTEVMHSENKIIGVYLGGLKRFEDRYAKPENMHLSKGERDIKLSIKSIHEPVTISWLNRGFDFFDKMGEKRLRIKWDSIPEMIKTAPESRYIEDLIEAFNHSTGANLYLHCYGYIPLIHVDDEARKIKEFIDNFKGEIDFDKSMLRNYFNEQNLTLQISRSLFYFQIAGTNPDAKKYARIVDEFLREK